MGPIRLIFHFVRSQLIKDSTAVGALKVASTLLTLLTGILLARLLGPSDYGIYAFVLSIITLLGLPTKAGLPALITRETATNQLQERWGYLRGLLALTNVFVLVFSLLIAITSYFVIEAVWRGGQTSRHVFLWALLLLPLVAFGNIRGATLRGLRKVIQGQLPELIIRPVILFVLLSGYLIAGPQLDPVLAVQFNIIASLVAFLIGAILLVKAMPPEVYKAVAEYEVRVWATSLIPLSLFAGLRTMDSQLVLIILGSLGTTEDVGLFRVAATGAALVAFGLTAINMVISPHVARLYKSGEIDKLQGLITNSTRLVAAIAFPVFFIFLIFGESILGIIFGEEYRPAATALTIMCFGQLVNSTCGSVVLVLNMTGFEKETLKGIGVSILLGIILSIMLIPSYGITGAAFAYTVSLSTWNIILIVVTRRKTGINTFIF